MSEGYHFWRKNVRPSTSFGPFSRTPTLWQRFYDWITKKGAQHND